MGDYDDAPDTELTTMNRFLTLCVELTYDKLRSTTIEGVDLNTLSFVSGDNESTYSVAPGSPLVTRSRRHKTTMNDNTIAVEAEDRSANDGSHVCGGVADE